MAAPGRITTLSFLVAISCVAGDATTPVDVPCSGETPSTVAACVEHERYAADLGEIAQVDRVTGGAHWQRVQDLCRDRFEAQGFEVELHTYPDGVGTNVIGRLPGATLPDEWVVLSAHYDAIAPSCPGADDNASGLAGVLEAARVLSANRYARTLVVACWDEHEIGLVGSRAWIDEQAAAEVNIAASYVFEMIGYRSDQAGSQSTAGLDIAFPNAKALLAQNDFRADFVAFIHNSLADEHGALLAQYAKSLPITSLLLPVPQADVELSVYRDLRRSDHAGFWSHGYPGAMITDTGPLRNPNYHCGSGEDAVATLDTQFATRVVQVVTAAVAHSLGLSGA